MRKCFDSVTSRKDNWTEKKREKNNNEYMKKNKTQKNTEENAAKPHTVSSEGEIPTHDKIKTRMKRSRKNERTRGSREGKSVKTIRSRPLWDCEGEGAALGGGGGGGGWLR